MYLVRRTFRTKPGEARRVAELVYKLARIYREAGQREEFRVAYNGGTVPGDPDIVVLEWETAAFQSPWRAGNDLPSTAEAAGAEFRPYLASPPSIEFWELLTPEQVGD